MGRRRRRSVALRTQRQAVDALNERLVDLYGQPEPGLPLPPLDEVVITILSQNTNDRNRDRAWERLRSRFPDWQSVVDAPAEQVEEALEPGGLHRIKAQRIRETLVEVHARHGDYDLGHLHDAEISEARAELSSIKGLGAKSVNCILLFSLGKPAFPVDTHVFRVLRRVGVHRCKDLSRTNDELQEPVADEIAYAFHVNLIRHGREVCHARRPQCGACGIRDLCAWQGKTG